MNEEAEFYRISEFCQRYAISRTGLYREVMAHRITVIKRGRTTLITRTEANRWFQALCNQNREHSPQQPHFKTQTFQKEISKNPY